MPSRHCFHTIQIRFFSNYLIAQFTVFGSERTKSQSYDVLVDTASEKSAIPLVDCQSLSLVYAGDYDPVTALGPAIFPTFDATVEVDSRRFEIQIMEIPSNKAVMGLDILSHYKLTIDWSANPKHYCSDYHDYG